MTLNEIKTAFATMHDDADSAGYFKKWSHVKHLTNRVLAEMCREQAEIKWPGCSMALTASGATARWRKAELVRHLVWLVG